MRDKTSPLFVANVVNPTRFIYLINPYIPHRGAITIATEVVGDGMKVGVAYCSPKDNFTKSVGRETASARLAISPVYPITTKKVTSLTTRMFATSLAMMDPHCPEWAKKILMVRLGETVDGWVYSNRHRSIS